MAKITITNQETKVIEFKENKIKSLSLLTILQEHDVAWKHACGGKGKCTTCRFNIVKGESNLSRRTDVENDFLSKKKILPLQRLACQAVPLGNLEVEVPEKCKVPGVNYI